MDEAGVLPRVTPRGPTPTFLRSSLQKLRADTSRRPADPQRDVSSRPSTGDEVPHRTALGHNVLADPPTVPLQVPLSAPPCGRQPRSYDTVAKDPSQINAFLARDVERHRAAFQDELRGKLQAVQQALQEADVAGLWAKLLTRLDLLEAPRQELEQLRAQNTDLLRLNTQLRQQQIDTNTTHMNQTCAKISAMVETLDSWEGIDMQAVSGAVTMALEPLKEGQLNMTAKLKRVESFSTGLVDEIRRLIQEELEPLKLGQEGMRARLKRVENVGLGSLSFRGVVQEEMRGLLGPRAKRTATEPHAPQGVEPQQATSATDLTEVAEAVSGFEHSTQQILASISEDRAKIFSTQGKLTLNQSAILQQLQELHAAVAGVQGGFRQLGEAVDETPSRVARQMTSLEDVEEADARRLRFQLGARNAQIKDLNHKLKEKESIVPFLHRIRTIEKRGNIRIDLRNGDVTFNREIVFRSRCQTEEPTAEFMNNGDALEVIADLADLWDNFKVDMSIEGFTKGGEGGFWQKLAANRASLVAAKLQELGVRRDLLHPEGLPGELGRNRVGVDVKLDIFPEVD